MFRRCRVLVHQHCYACREEPEEGTPWFCDVCDDGGVRRPEGLGEGVKLRGVGAYKFAVCVFLLGLRDRQR